MSLLEVHESSKYYLGRFRQLWLVGCYVGMVYLQGVGDDDEEGHELLHRGGVVQVPVDAPHQLSHHSSTRPDLNRQHIVIFMKRTHFLRISKKISLTMLNHDKSL